MNCEFRNDKNCTIAAKLAGLDVVTTATDPACQYCTTRATPPRDRNKVTCDLAIAALRLAGRLEDGMALMRSSVDIYPPPPSGAERLQRIEAANGVGSNLWRLLASLGVKHTAACSCLSLAEWMNALGPDGCRRERPNLVAKMRDNAQQYGWGTVATAATRSVLTGLAFRLDLTDLYGSLLDEAIRLTEVHEPRINPGCTTSRSVREPIDVLIPVGRGSKHDDVELRFALRSIQRHARGVRRVWIVGHIPLWIHQTDQVRLVPREEAPGNKAYRIAAKVEWACCTLDLSETFAFWNDDYLLTQNFDIRDIPAWYHGDLFRGQESEGWQRMLGKTGEALQAAGLPARHFDIHVPMLFERQKFIALSAWWARSKDGGSYTMKSVYGNHYCDSVAVPYPDAKLADQWPHRIDQLTTDRPVLSYGDEALRADFGPWMAVHYPHAHPAEQVVVAVLGQFRGGTSCVAGILHALGVSMGSGWRPRRTNPNGTFEGAALGRLCRQAFREPALQERMTPAQRVKRFRRWANRRREPLIGAKHPTMCLCVPQLVAAWPAVRFVAVDRPAEESVASMAKAMWSWTPQQAEDGTRRLIQTRDADLVTCGRPVIRVSYHDLLANPESIIRSLVGFAGVAPDEATIQKAIATVDPKLRTVSTT